ncbi:hypothetical protein K2173_002130 [Erythroxylum novogranatense]|uniref:Uncharacterized protein n=1 Tax=Erythroxylum novogranatense TaxID=1862640 RepID=A0AAV8SQM4_9ROSI|nr:hypothetical protein K2173_002130 [Erythroxylum novogranatense]
MPRKRRDGSRKDSRNPQLHVVSVDLVESLAAQVEKPKVPKAIIGDIEASTPLLNSIIDIKVCDSMMDIHGNMVGDDGRFDLQCIALPPADLSHVSCVEPQTIASPILPHTYGMTYVPLAPCSVPEAGLLPVKGLHPFLELECNSLT